MLCAICKNGDLKPGESTVTLERDGMVMVVRKVPALVCENCGEEYVAEQETVRVMQTAEEAARAGVKMDVRDYVAA